MVYLSSSYIFEIVCKVQYQTMYSAMQCMNELATGSTQTRTKGDTPPKKNNIKRILSRSNQTLISPISPNYEHDFFTQYERNPHWFLHFSKKRAVYLLII